MDRILIVDDEFLIRYTLEEGLKEQGILNVNACIACTERKDAHLTNDKVSEDMGRLQERIGNKFELTDNKMAEVVISTPQIKRTKRMKP